MMEGTVKWFNVRKGFGFVNGEDGEDYFIHHSALEQGTFLREDDRVSFEAADTDKGKQAQNVALLQKGSEIRAQSDESSKEAPEEETSEEPAEEETSEEETSEDSEEAPEEETSEEPAEEETS
ncbi:cold shock domain-containing protein, partial [archaeon]|nr:cold shock domain-containing protein [archaeon]